jgi:hypothetical protein
MLLALFVTAFYYFFAAGLLFGYSIEGISPPKRSTSESGKRRSHSESSTTIRQLLRHGSLLYSCMRLSVPFTSAWTTSSYLN